MKQKNLLRGGGIRSRLIAAVAAGSMVLLAIGGVAGTASAVDTLPHQADGDTSDTYGEVLGDANSTRYSGRVWTDKSVSSDDKVAIDGESVEKDGSDFLVTYSALASSQHITGGAAPSDTVFILDLSASMTWGYDKPQEAETQGASRLQAMVDSVNTTIDTLVKANPQNRIAIVTFNGNVDVDNTGNFLDLTTGDQILEQVKDGEYLRISKWKSGDDENKDDTSATVYCNISKNSADTAGGTNIQAGLFRGMSILAHVDSTTVTVNGQSMTRVPNVVLMSDGAPTTFSSAEEDVQYREYKDRKDECKGGYQTGSIDRNTRVCRAAGTSVYSGSWWSTNSGEQIGAGDNNNPDSADGFMALLTASYFKNVITRNYYGSSTTGEQANVYTVGFATNVQNAEMAMMANIVLNPAEYLDKAQNFAGSNNQDNNNEIKQVYSAAQSYLTGEDAVVQGSIGDGGSDDQIRFEVNSRPEDGNDPTSLNYPTRAFTAEDDEELEQALSQIADLIAEPAKSPTETNDSDPVNSGWITYEDPIGEHMQVDGVKALIWNGRRFDNPTRTPEQGFDETGKATYMFAGPIESPIYGMHDVSEIKVTVYADASGKQTLKVGIPASAIPIRVAEVTLDANGECADATSNGMLPLRLVYGVSLDADVTPNGVLDKDAVAGYLSNPKTGAEHVNGNTAYFYTNQYSRNQGADTNAKTVGDAKATFRPAADNPYYFLQEDTPLYSDQECTSPATADLAAPYYYKIPYYADGNREDVVSFAGSLLSSLESGKDYMTDENGQVYLTAGAPNLGNLGNPSADKAGDGNPTKTARAYRYATRNSSDGSVTMYLGNNGRVAIPIPVDPATADIKVSKTIEGVDSVDVDFTFDLMFVNENVEGIAGSQITDSDQVKIKDKNGAWTAWPEQEGDAGTVQMTVEGPFNSGTSKTGVFGLQFAQAGIYVFSLRENTAPQLSGWTYDDKEYSVVVTVTPESNDPYSLSASVQYQNGDDSSVEDAQFTNTFTSVTALPLTGGDTTARNIMLAGGGVLMLAGAAWLLARRRRV